MDVPNCTPAVEACGSRGALAQVLRGLHELQYARQQRRSLAHRSAAHAPWKGSVMMRRASEREARCAQ